ncbi:hypothetical protein BV22DRAFT_1048322 [Leucogyrophana mollusca]|uniref:Uncharacterized protein n=1 Tax=Leucogyrophana mollusca TaxID=85980 RepID=A0ACB8BC47_9AGAM|nr:hypothetical protein BV22DRAFT_1048322 [Leucogyrophana mollusca]
MLFHFQVVYIHGYCDVNSSLRRTRTVFTKYLCRLDQREDVSQGTPRPPPSDAHLHSLGSTAPGSPVATPLEILKLVLNAARNSANALRNPGGVFSRAAYAYIEIGAERAEALYGKVYISAARDPWNMFKDRRIDALVNGSLVSMTPIDIHLVRPPSTVLTWGAHIVALLCSFAYLYLHLVTYLCDQGAKRIEQSGDGTGGGGAGHPGDYKQYPLQRESRGWLAARRPLTSDVSPYPHHRYIPVILSVNYSQPLRPYNAEGQYTTPVALLAFLIGLQCCMVYVASHVRCPAALLILHLSHALSFALEAGVSTIFVGLDEDPQVLAVRAPALYGARCVRSMSVRGVWLMSYTPCMSNVR